MQANGQMLGIAHEVCIQREYLAAAAHGNRMLLLQLMQRGVDGLYPPVASQLHEISQSWARAEPPPPQRMPQMPLQAQPPQAQRAQQPAPQALPQPGGVLDDASGAGRKRAREEDRDGFLDASAAPTRRASSNRVKPGPTATSRTFSPGWTLACCIATW